MMNTARLRQILGEEEFYPDQRRELDRLMRQNTDGYCVAFELDDKIVVYEENFDCLVPFEVIDAKRLMSAEHYKMFLREAKAKTRAVWDMLLPFSQSDRPDFLACKLDGGRVVLAHDWTPYFGECPIVALEDQ